MKCHVIMIVLGGCLLIGCSKKENARDTSKSVVSRDTENQSKLKADLIKLCAFAETEWTTSVIANFGAMAHGQVQNLVADITREKSSKFTRILQLRDMVARHGLERCQLLTTMAASPQTLPRMKYLPFPDNQSPKAFDVDAKEGVTTTTDTSISGDRFPVLRSANGLKSKKRNGVGKLGTNEAKVGQRDAGTPQDDGQRKRSDPVGDDQNELQ